jgi:hypothetical protein
MPSYFGVENGNYSSGYLIANGNVYPAVSGSGSLRDIPAGSYTHGDGEVPRADQPTMTDGTGRQKFRKFHVIGTGPSGEIWDPRKNNGKGGWRDGIELHYDGGNPGTAGCIGYQDPAAKDAITADPDKSVNVQYLADDEAVKRAVELRLGHPVDWSKINPPKKPGGGGSGTQSKTKKGKKVQKGNPKVLVGPKQRQIAHQQAMLEGGGVVAEGNPTVLVGSEQYPVSRIEHMTTDGSPLADGEDSVLLS